MTSVRVMSLRLSSSRTPISMHSCVSSLQKFGINNFSFLEGVVEKLETEAEPSPLDVGDSGANGGDSGERGMSLEL